MGEEREVKLGIEAFWKKGKKGEGGKTG